MTGLHIRVAAASLLMAGMASAALAHHGWSWAEGEQTELRGTVREVYIGQPHPTLRVTGPDNQLWTVELGNPRQTASAGFNAESARAGDQIVALGNRAQAAGERRMKAVRITVRDRTYDIYPDRITRNQKGVLQAISDLPLAAALRGSAIAYPLVNAAHIATFGILLGAIATLDLRLLGAFRSHGLRELGPPLWRVAAWGLAAAAVTGLLLFSTRAPAYAENPAFLAKLGLIGIGLVNVASLRLNPHWARALEGGPIHLSVRLAAALSLLAWLGAVLAGRWIGFLQ